MTEKRLIQGTYSTRRYLHSDEVFCKERNWNINLPNEREFKNGYCIATDKNDTAYSIDELVDLLNELREEKQQLKKTLRIIADAKSVRDENSVKEILRNNLFGLDTVAEESFNAYKDYTLLNNFFKDYYNEYWDNDKYD